MIHRVLLIVSILTNIVVGHLCVMPMAMAADIPMHHDESLEMIMTPLQPMSPVHCDDCAHITEQEPHGDFGCMDHCLSQANAVTPLTTQNSALILVAAALPTAIVTVTHDAANLQGFVQATAPPPQEYSTHTVVLLQ